MHINDKVKLPKNNNTLYYDFSTKKRETCQVSYNRNYCLTILSPYDAGITNKQTKIKPPSINVQTICDVTHRSVRRLTRITFHLVTHWSSDLMMLYARNRKRSIRSSWTKEKPCRPYCSFEHVQRNLKFYPILVTLTEKDFFIPFKHKAATRINLPGNKKTQNYSSTVHNHDL
jgi:hypothetical protein